MSGVADAELGADVLLRAVVGVVLDGEAHPCHRERQRAGEEQPLRHAALDLAMEPGVAGILQLHGYSFFMEGAAPPLRRAIRTAMVARPTADATMKSRFDMRRL